MEKNSCQFYAYFKEDIYTYKFETGKDKFVFCLKKNNTYGYKRIYINEFPDDSILISNIKLKDSYHPDSLAAIEKHTKPKTRFTQASIVKELVNMGSTYLQNLAPSFLAFGIELSLAAILQGIGKTRAIMYAALLRTAINILLDWILIYGNLGFPEMGIKGAAVATTISNYSATFLFIIYFLSQKKLMFKPAFKGILKPKWSIERNNISCGIYLNTHACHIVPGNCGHIRIERVPVTGIRRL